MDWTWLAAMAGALRVSFAGYHAAYRGIYRAEGGFRLPRGRLLAVVMAGFSGFFAHDGRHVAVGDHPGARGRPRPLGRRVVRRPAPGRPGWRGHVSVLLDLVRLATALFRRPLRHRSALGGMLTFWAAEIFAVWAGLAARCAPRRGGTMTLILPVTIWTCGAPLAVAVAGTVAYRAQTL